MKKRYCILCFLILFSILLHGCDWSIPNDPSKEGSEKMTETETIPVWERETYSYRTEVDETVLSTKNDPAYLLIVNKQHPLPSSFIPTDLTTVSCRSKEGLQLEARAEAALAYLMAEMEADGACDVKVTSAYRNYQYQNTLYQMYVTEEMNANGIGETEAKKIVDTYSARPGYSEHQSGLCVDLIGEQSLTLDKSFESTKAFAWLSENAYRFGFILRYPEKKEAVTGYSYEPWHYRFVGREAATEIFFRGITLEEYCN